MAGRLVRQATSSSGSAGGSQARCASPRSETELGLGLLLTRDDSRRVLRERRAVLEAVTRAAAEDPLAVAAGVPRDHEVRVRRERVLADRRVAHGCIPEGWKPLGQIRTGGVLRLR